MNKKNSSKSPIVAYWYKRVNALQNNKSILIPEFGLVTNYKPAAGVYGKRRFKISGSSVVPNGGNLSLANVTKHLKAAIV